MATKTTIASIKTQLTQLGNQLTELDQHSAAWQKLLTNVEELTQTTAQQELLLETSVAISDVAGSIIDVDELLKVAANIIRDNFEFKQVLIYTLDRSGGWIEPRADTNSEVQKNSRVKLNKQNSIGRAVLERQPQVESGSGSKNGETSVTEAIFPLVSRGQVTGVLVIYNTETANGLLENATYLQTLADQLANTLHNATLYKASDNRLEQLIALHNINIHISSVDELPQLLADVVELSSKLIGAQSVVIRLVDAAQSAFEIKAAFNAPANLPVGKTEPIDGSVSGQVLQSKKPLIVNEWPHHELAENNKQLQKDGRLPQSLLSIPISSQGNTFGVIEAYHYDDPHAFDNNDLYALSLMSGQAAIAIDNVRLLNQAEESQRFLKTVIEHIPDPIFIKDKNHTWIEMNRANAKIIGQPAETLIGKNDWEHFPLELAEEFYRRDNEVFTNNEIVEFEDKTIWSDGQEHIAYTRLIPIPEADGQPEYLLGITHDITERKAHEAERERFLEETAALYNGSQEIAGALTERKIVDALIKQIRLQDPCEIAVYRFKSVEGEPMWAELYTGRQKRNNPTYPSGSKIYLPDSPQRALLTSTTAHFLDDIDNHPQLSAAEKESFAPTAAHSAAILPLGFLGHQLGVVAVYFTSPFEFSAVTERFWIAMADQAGMAWSNRRLIQEAAYRAIQMETAAEVSHAAGSLLNLKDLLTSAVALVRDRFNLYYVAVYLADAQQEWADFQAGTGKAGRKMLQNKHRIKINKDTIIGQVIANRQPHVGLDVGKNAIKFNNPDLPDTRSEIALPLIHHHQVIGALTLQSKEAAAFSKEDVIFFQTMADQLANAIQNARLFDQAQREIAERRQAEEELQKLSVAVEQSPNIVAITDTDGNFSYVNPSFTKITGYLPEEVYGKNTRILQSGHTEAALYTDLWQTIQQGKTWHGQFHNRRKNGEYYWAEATITPIQTAQGDISHYLALQQDITKRKKAEQEILRRNRELAAFNRVVAAITTAVNPQERLRDVVSEIVQVFEAAHSGIALLNPEDKSLTIVADFAKESKDASTEGEIIPIDNNPSTQKVLETKKTLVITDAQHNPLTKPIHALMQRRNVETIMLLPLLSRSQVIGTLGIDLTEPERTFSPADIRLAETIAGQIAGAIENAQLLKQTQEALAEREQVQQALKQRERYLSAHLEIQNILLATRDKVPPYDQVLAILGQVSGASRVYVFENHDNPENYLLTSQKAEWVNEGIEPQIDNPDLQELSLYDLLPRWVEEMIMGFPVVGKIKDFPPNEQEILEPQDIKAMLVLPLSIGSEFFGFIGFDNCTTDELWDDSEQSLLSTAAAAISLWYERRRAEEDLLKALQSTGALYHIGSIMATSTSKAETFEVVLKEYLYLVGIEPAYGSIILFEHNRGFSRVHTLVIDDIATLSNLSIPVSQDRIGQHLIKSRQPLVVENVQTHKLTRNSPKFWMQHPSVHALLFTPLIMSEGVVGVISVGITKNAEYFTKPSIETSQRVADQLSIWLENQQLLAETRYRTEQLQTSAEVSQAASSILDMDELINTSVNLIRDQFNFYYVGLFLLDDNREWAVLKAGTGKAGRIQLARNHRLKAGGESMIGWSVANRKARIALDVGEEAVHFKNPILPDTHSEMALPLISRNQVLGALTVQSVERGAFNEQDITLLQTMADQLANALANARLFEGVTKAQQESEKRLKETEALQKLSQNLATTLEIKDILKVFFQACEDEIGFDYIQLALVDKPHHCIKTLGSTGPLSVTMQNTSQPLDSKNILADVVRSGKTEIIVGWDERLNREQIDVEDYEDWVRLFTPVTLRHENIGVVEAGFSNTQKTNILNDQIRLLQAFINQTALALDNAQRYAASQRATRREAMIKEITTKVRASTKLDDILKTTVKELGNAIHSKRTYIHLSPTVEENDESGKGNGANSPLPHQRGGSANE